jgi:hypothetical protein
MNHPSAERLGIKTYFLGHLRKRCGIKPEEIKIIGYREVTTFYDSKD